jgi:hypothetical protein
MMLPLSANPNPKRVVFLVPEWHHAMALLSFKLDQLFTLMNPEFVVWFKVGVVSFPSEPYCVQNSLSILSNFVIP